MIEKASKGQKLCNKKKKKEKKRSGGSERRDIYRTSKALKTAGSSAEPTAGHKAVITGKADAKGKRGSTGGVLCS